ncbi:MAG: ankyrin repeat domain-containing protein [Candidatus Solibacter sp.]|nr:ankyrin repeat domain-containing protein [Candidatus Solibacter sp.]
MRKLCLFGVAACLCAVAGAQSPADELIQAIRNNDLASLKASLAKGAQVNTRDQRGSTLLMHAAALGSPEAVRLLLGSGADVNARNDLEATALILGAGNPEKARMLVEKGADVNAHSKLGRTPLMIAAGCDGCAATVKLLLDKGADPDAKDKEGNTALTAAAWADNSDSVKLILAKGAGADVADGEGYTPLSAAASNCNLEAVKLFLSKGANVNTANTRGGEVKFGKIQLIKLTPLMLASTYCAPDLVKTLLDAGAKVNDADIRGMTAIQFAVSSEAQNPAVVKLLLKGGAEVNARSSAGETALDWAGKFGSQEVIAALTAAGAREGVPYSPPRTKPAGERTVSHAVENGAAILQRGAMEFFKQSGCVGCHHQPAAAVAVAAARAAGIHVDESAAKGSVKMMEGESLYFNQSMLERAPIGGATDGPTWKLMGLASERYPASPLTDAIVAYIAESQRHDGSWWSGGVSRAPLEEGAMARTAMAIRAMQVFGSPAMKMDLDLRISRARTYLANAKPATNDEAAMQILGLHWAGGNAAQVSALGKTLAGAQHADGGWSQNRNPASDAYATGEALSALMEAGVLTASDPVYQKGVKFLMDTQGEDGSWYVRSRAPKFQPYFQSGFPYDHDQWISSAATSWAVRALVPAVRSDKKATLALR